MNLTKFLPDTGFYSNESGFDGNSFQLDFLKKFTGQFALNAKTLIYQSTTFKDTSIVARLENEALILDDFIASGDNKVGSTLQARGT